MDKYEAGQVVDNRIKLTMEQRGLTYLDAYDAVRAEMPELLQAYDEVARKDAKRLDTLRETLRVKYPGAKWLYNDKQLVRAVLDVIEEQGGSEPLGLAIGEALKRKSTALLQRWIDEQA